MRVAIFLFFMSLGKVAQSVIPPTLSERPFLLSEQLLGSPDKPGG